MSETVTLARKELLDLRRDRVVWIVVGTLGLAVVLSVVVASLDFRAQLADYEAYAAQVKASGSGVTPAAPQLFPLQLLRGGMEYVEVLGALFALMIGYGAIAKERSRGTVDLLLTRARSGTSIVMGKLLGLAILWAVIMAAVVVTALASVALIGGSTIGWHEVGRMALAGAAGWVYAVFWSAIAVAVTTLTRNSTAALLTLLVLWLVIVLVIPQIGDTMDPDNQVPGGLFKALAIAKPDEHAVLHHFATYESLRNGLEVSSLSKLYERFTFATLGIKDIYNGQSLAVVWDGTFRYVIGALTLTGAALTFAAASGRRIHTLRRS
ncbi:ABC transporter permease [Demequina soli]|uniref:ABC transporter permease n=1 Tax=Demequina soli TaxID=1638987 RepID=UPI0007833C13|nr:ABC transporter permease subunit [Demequina soli]